MTDVETLLSNPALKPEEVRRLLRTSRNGIYNAIRDGSVPSFKCGGQYRVPTAWVRAQLQLPEPEAA